MGSTNPISRSRPRDIRLVSYGGVFRLQNSTLLLLAIIFSLFFITALSCSFFGDDGEEPFFKNILNEVAQTDPGIVMLGENVDVDVDEPSISIRWSIIGCGDGYVLDGSVGIHESSSCGLPSMPLQIYVDSSDEPTAVYDPSQLPFVRGSGQRRNIQNLVQFDSDHTLDVHEDRLYPFDTYLLTSTLRVVNTANETVPIRKISTIEMVSSFTISVTDVDSYESLVNGTDVPSRDIDMRVKRPGQARTFTLLLFGISWMLTHATVGHVMLARAHKEVKPIIKHLVFVFAILVVIPQLRNSMPDAPGFDGVLIDCIGFFPQMILSSFSALTLLLLIILREFNHLEDTSLGDTAEDSEPQTLPISPTRMITSPLPSPKLLPSPPQSPLKPLILGKARTSSLLLQGGEVSRIVRHLNGEFVFPPVPQIHRRSRSSKPTLGRTGGVVRDSESPKVTTLETVEEK